MNLSSRLVRIGVLTHGFGAVLHGHVKYAGHLSMHESPLLDQMDHDYPADCCPVAVSA